jgi:hemerythrin superfamily protein
MTDVIQLIEHDHREVEDLFAKFRTTKDASIPPQICDDLDKHADAEEQALYPAIEADVPNGESMVKEAVDEHKEARQLIGRIRQTKDEDHLAELMHELEQAVAHHVDEEESEVLPKTRAALSPERLEELGKKFESAKS